MNYVTLGKTGLKAAVVSFGGIPIQRADGANTKAVVDKLEEYGINYIDTARGYTVSEEYLGAALEGRRDKFILATKSMSRDAASMAADVETSLRNLRTGYIDLYQLHNLPEKDIEKVFGPGGGQFLPGAEAPQHAAAGQAGVVRGVGIDIAVADIQYAAVRRYAKACHQRAGALGCGLGRYIGQCAAHDLKQAAVEVPCHHGAGEFIGFI